MALSPSLFALFSSLVEDACGLHYSPNEHELFSAKLEAYAADLGHESLLDFYYRLKYDDPDGAELRRLVEVLVVHETYFFRELAPLETLVEDHLAHIVLQRGRARVWSAACATGEELYTLAMLLDARGMLEHVELTGTDISAPAIERARSGLHGRRALREGHPVHLANRYLVHGPAGVRVTPPIRDAVKFSTLNLFDAPAIAALGTFDVILCRNVLIYFRESQVSRVVDHLAAALAPDGLLAVGIAESLLRFGTSLVCEERGRSFFYRRAA